MGWHMHLTSMKCWKLLLFHWELRFQKFHSFKWQIVLIWISRAACTRARGCHILNSVISTAKMQTFILLKVLHLNSPYIKMFIFVYSLGHLTWQWMKFKIHGRVKYFVCDLFPGSKFCRRLCGDILISVEDLLFAESRNGINRKRPVRSCGWFQGYTYFSNSKFWRKTSLIQWKMGIHE